MRAMGPDTMRAVVTSAGSKGYLRFSEEGAEAEAEAEATEEEEEETEAEPVFAEDEVTLFSVATRFPAVGAAAEAVVGAARRRAGAGALVRMTRAGLGVGTEAAEGMGLRRAGTKPRDGEAETEAACEEAVEAVVEVPRVEVDRRL